MLPESCDNFLYGFKGAPSARHGPAGNRGSCRTLPTIRVRAVIGYHRVAAVAGSGSSARDLRAAGSAAPYTKRASGRGGLPQAGRQPLRPRRLADAHVLILQLQELAVRPPRARHPVAGRRSQSRPLAALAPCGWRYAPALSVIFPGKILAPIRRTVKHRELWPQWHRCDRRQWPRQSRYQLWRGLGSSLSSKVFPNYEP